ncbi:MAG: hypothetical protein E7E98_08455 [Cutibacterium avidum]|nr:hypothetical protein [Cutibacterium avidum]
MIGMQHLEVGQWGLFCDGGNSIVRVDAIPCGPASARRLLDSVPRRILVDDGRIVRTLASGRPIREHVDMGGDQWYVRADPILSPHSRVPVAVAAIVTPDDRIPPDPPSLGCWEWEIEPGPDGGPSTTRRIYWDKNLFDLYDLDPRTSRRHDDYWETGEWIDNLIDPGDRVRMSDAVRDGIAISATDRPGDLLCLTYGIVTGRPGERSGRRHLRLVGGIRPEGRIFVARGFSYEAPDWFTDMSLWRDTEATRVDDVLSGMMELIDDPVAVVDTRSLEILVTSDSWREAGFDRFGGFDAVVDDQGDRVRDYVMRVSDQDRHVTSMTTRLRRLDGSTREVVLEGIGVRNGGRDRDALLRVRRYG